MVFIHQANYELVTQESIAASAVPKMEQQVQRQFMEITSRSHDCETSRNGQIHLLEELRDFECARQDTPIRMSEEEGELKKVRCPEAKLREDRLHGRKTQNLTMTI